MIRTQHTCFRDVVEPENKHFVEVYLARNTCTLELRLEGHATNNIISK